MNRKRRNAEIKRTEKRLEAIRHRMLKDARTPIVRIPVTDARAWRRGELFRIFHNGQTTRHYIALGDDHSLWVVKEPA